MVHMRRTTAAATATITIKTAATTTTTTTATTATTTTPVPLWKSRWEDMWTQDNGRQMEEKVEVGGLAVEEARLGNGEAVRTSPEAEYCNKQKMTEGPTG